MRTMRKGNRTRKYLINEWNLNGTPLFKVTMVQTVSVGYRGPLIGSTCLSFESREKAEASVNRAIKMCERNGYKEDI